MLWLETCSFPPSTTSQKFSTMCVMPRLHSQWFQLSFKSLLRRLLKGLSVVKREWKIMTCFLQWNMRVRFKSRIQQRGFPQGSSQRTRTFCTRSGRTPFSKEHVTLGQSVVLVASGFQRNCEKQNLSSQKWRPGKLLGRGIGQWTKSQQAWRLGQKIV